LADTVDTFHSSSLVAGDEWQADHAAALLAFALFFFLQALVVSALIFKVDGVLYDSL